MLMRGTSEPWMLSEKVSDAELAKFRGSGGVWLKKGPTGGKKNFRFSAAGVNAQGLHPFLPACQQVKHTVSSTKLGCFGTENSILQLKKANLRHFWAKII